jgi:hypothetical protein
MVKVDAQFVKEQFLEPRWLLLVLLYYTIQYYIMQYYTILFYTILHYTILYYTTLYYTTLDSTTLYYTIRVSILPYYYRKVFSGGLVGSVGLGGLAGLPGLVWVGWVGNTSARHIIASPLTLLPLWGGAGQLANGHINPKKQTNCHAPPVSLVVAASCTHIAQGKQLPKTQRRLKTISLYSQGPNLTMVYKDRRDVKGENGENS